MNDLEVKNFLQEVSADNPLDPVDTTALLARGRRGRRRRRITAWTGAAAAVCAVAVGAATLPDLGARTDDAPPAATSAGPPTVHSPGFVRLPGVPDGEAALGEAASGDLLLHEALARCRLRNPQIPDDLTNALVGVGRVVHYKPRDPRRDSPICIVPGDSRPLPATVAAAQADPLPATEAGMLRNCSVLMWHDLTGWRVVTSERVPGLQLNMLAMSPSGRSIAMCKLKPGVYDEQVTNTTEGIFSAETYWETSLSHVGDYGYQTCTERSLPCVGWMADNVGRVDSRIARIRLTARNGRTHDIAVHDGWFALAWGDGDGKGQPNARLEAFDAAGRRVR